MGLSGNSNLWIPFYSLMRSNTEGVLGSWFHRGEEGRGRESRGEGRRREMERELSIVNTVVPRFPFRAQSCVLPGNGSQWNCFLGLL